MSVLIEGMAMPTEGTVIAIYKLNGKFYASVHGTELCRLIPVPPHGRLGDLDKLVEKIDAIWDCNDMVFSPNDHCCNVPEDCKGCKWAETKNFIRRMVANAQTIIPASGGKEESE